MTPEPASQSARYVTVQDYLRVLRRYALLIVLVAAVGAAAGLADAARQTPVYEATSAIALQDPAQDLGIVGLGSGSVETPGQLAAVNSENATSPAVMAAAQRALKSPFSAADLAGAISTSVDTTSGQLLISAQASTADFAARLANAVARAVVARDNAQARSQFTALAATIQHRIAKLSAPGAAGGPQLSFYEDELPRLQTLASFARSAQLTSLAQPPGSPSSPDTTRSVMLGLVLGLLLGIVVAFIRDSTDRRLRSLPDIRNMFELPVLGHVRNGSMGRVVLGASASGDDDPVDHEAFRILRRNLEFLDREHSPKLILVTSGVPEEGKTTVASSLALAMASMHRRTLLVDCDLRKPTLAKRLDVQPRPGLTDYLTGDARPEDILTTIELAHRGPDRASTNGHGPTSGAERPRPLVFIPAGSPSRRSAELLGSPRFHEFLREVSDSYDVVVLDSSPLLPVSDTRELLPLVDAVVLCARASQTTREQATAVRTALAHFPERPTGLVVTGVSPRDPEYAAGAYGYAYDYS
jgi:Mrp family chromosome partitioning ATPase/capsular polysaccharide biosynthesis protein